MAEALNRWEALADRSIAGEPLTREEALDVLHCPETELLWLLNAAFRVRREFHGLKVQIHILENAKMGACPEDCSFCSQSAKYQTDVKASPRLAVEDLVAGARRARDSKAWRYCMVTATRGPSTADLDVICEAARRIKSEIPGIHLCASLGLLNEAKAKRLAEAGVDRFNHNLETSERNFPNVTTTHSYQDRVDTLRHAKKAGMELCSGGIVGLDETEADLIELAFALREIGSHSVPVNLLNPRPGTPLEEAGMSKPTYALKVFCMFRFLHPRADLRAAGGREVVLRSMQPFALYPCNSIFSSGYLTTPGAEVNDDHKMIEDMGFEIEYVGFDGGEHGHDHGTPERESEKIRIRV